MTGTVAEVVEAGDLDELLRWVDRLCEAGAWDALVDLADRSRRAHERGRQLWPAAAHAEYRLALEAPGPWSGVVATSQGAGRFAAGPLAEVAASTHEWSELAPHLRPGPAAAMVAHERVIRGDDLETDPRVVSDVLELPLRLQPWEPSYAVASYRADGGEFPAPASTPLAPVRARAAGRAEPIDDPEVIPALLALVESWVVESNGHAQAIAVEGDGLAAIAALHGDAPVRAAEVTAAEALADMAWAGASGGAHGRRRGAATGRFGGWWALAALTGLSEDWPPPTADLGRAADELRWWRWAPDPAPAGWALHLAVADPDEGLAWAVAATDHV